MYHGYTGHEHMDELGIIHMNGRLYDPVMARFVSADFLIEDPYTLQSYNRYSYVWNNPLANTDASGQCFICVVAIVSAVVGRATGVIDTKTMRGIIGVAAGAWMGPGFFSSSLGSFGSAMAVGGITGGISSGWNGVGSGALSAGLFYGAGSLTEGLPSGSFGKVMAHAVAGCVGASATGGNCGSGALSAGFAEFAGPKIGDWGDANAFKYAIVGGVASVLGGGKFQNGAMNGAFGYLFNKAAHLDEVPFSTNEEATQVPDSQAPIQIAANASCMSGGGIAPCIDGGSGSASGGAGGGAAQISAPYQRPSGATTRAQRENVQGQPCVDCGAITSRQFADHKTPLVQEYYQTGRIDTGRMRSIDSVQPHCPTCSARQGAEMSRYSRQKKMENGF